MGSLRAELISRNRFGKRYPVIRAPKRMTYRGDEYLAIEVGSITFSEDDTGSLTFEAKFPDVNYQIVAIARETSNTDQANVNIFIDSANTSQSKVTVKASAPFTGIVDIIALRLGT